MEKERGNKIIVFVSMSKYTTTYLFFSLKVANLHLNVAEYQGYQKAGWSEWLLGTLLKLMDTGHHRG